MMEGFSVRLFQIARNFVGVKYNSLTPEEKLVASTVCDYLYNAGPAFTGEMCFDGSLIMALRRGIDNGVLSKEVQNGVFDILYEDAWTSGHAARMDKQTPLSCPFSDASSFAEAWRDGWMDADMEERHKNRSSQVKVGSRVRLAGETGEGVIIGIELSDLPFLVRWDDGDTEKYMLGCNLDLVNEDE